MRIDTSQLKIAVIHDWLTGMRGGEKVLDAILELYPQAELFTLFYRPGKLNSRIEKRAIHVSFLNRLPFSYKYYRYLLPLFPLAIEQFDLSKFDLILSSSHCVAKGVIPPPGALHVSYTHSPMRYIWDKRRDYFRSSFLRILLAPILHQLRIWDVSSSSRVDYFLANSDWIRKKIRKYYRREAQVIYPFFNSDHFFPERGDRGEYYLIASAFAPYKRIDLAIQACEKLKRPLWIVGSGQEEKQLRALAGSHTRFLGQVTSEELRDLMAGAKAFLFPGEEDFGIAPLEAMACGTPVIAYGQGGATESVDAEKTGVFFKSPTQESLADTILHFESLPYSWSENCVRQANLFSRNLFLKNFSRFIEEALQASALAQKSHQQKHPLV